MKKIYLGQMKTVYPTAFNFRWEKNIPGHYDKRSEHHLTIECRPEDEEQTDGSVRETKDVLNATMLIRRRKSRATKA